MEVLLRKIDHGGIIEKDRQIKKLPFQTMNSRKYIIQRGNCCKVAGEVSASNGGRTPEKFLSQKHETNIAGACRRKSTDLTVPAGRRRAETLEQWELTDAVDCENLSSTAPVYHLYQL
jgi:hypothetical protein